MPTYQVKLFGRWRELFETDPWPVQGPAVWTIADLRDSLAALLPNESPLLTRSLWAVNHQYVGPATPIKPADEIAIIPPVSGG